MPRKPSPASKTSLYRIKLAPDIALLNAVKSDYLDRETFSQREVSVGSRPALLVYGQIPNEDPDWLDHVQSLTEFRPPCKNDTSASVLVLRLTDSADHCYALCWGMGHLTIDSARMDDGFGLRFALRRADSDQISALTTHALDTLPRTARLSVFGGAAINSFGMEEIGEVVSRIVGKIPADGLSSDKADGSGAFVTVRGADALSVPLGKEASQALNDLTFIDRVIRTEEPAEGLEHLENTRPLRPGHPLIADLEKRFDERVADLSPGRIALCWPAEWNEDVGEAGSYRVTGLRGDNFTVSELELDDLIAPVAEQPDPDKLERLRRIDVQGLAEGGSAISRKISADKWITFECDLPNRERYVMQRGRWYNVGGAYIKMLGEKVARILAAESDVQLPSWPQQEKIKKRTGDKYIARADESAYNKWVAKNSSDLLCMDRKLVKSEQHPSGFEACDLLRTDGVLIHVKHLGDSVSASHLFNQALVSAEALRRQSDAVEEFRRLAKMLSGGSHVLPADYRPRQVVLAFSGGGAIQDSLFTFSKIALARLAQRLGELEVGLEIARLDEVEDVVDFT